MQPNKVFTAMMSGVLAMGLMPWPAYAEGGEEHGYAGAQRVASQDGYDLDADADAEAEADAAVARPGDADAHLAPESKARSALGLFEHIRDSAQAGSAEYVDAQCAIDILTGTSSEDVSYPAHQGSPANSDAPQSVSYAPGDAVSLDSVERALELVDEFNACRAAENESEGTTLSTDVGVNCRMMAVSIVLCDQARAASADAGAYEVEASVLHGAEDPFDSWYRGEKATYDQLVANGEEYADFSESERASVSHYLSIVDYAPTGEQAAHAVMATGFAVADDGEGGTVFAQPYYTHADSPVNVSYTAHDFQERWLDPYAAELSRDVAVTTSATEGEDPEEDDEYYEGYGVAEEAADDVPGYSEGDYGDPGVVVPDPEPDVGGGDSYAVIPAKGTCGTCVWTIDADGNMLIAPADGESGTLDPIDYYENIAPWWACYDSVVSIKVADGVSANKVFVAAFENFSRLTSADLTGFDFSATTSSGGVFYGCESLRSLAFGDNVPPDVAAYIIASMSGFPGSWTSGDTVYDTAYECAQAVYNGTSSAAGVWTFEPATTVPDEPEVAVSSLQAKVDSAAFDAEANLPVEEAGEIVIAGTAVESDSLAENVDERAPSDSAGSVALANPSDPADPVDPIDPSESIAQQDVVDESSLDLAEPSQSDEASETDEPFEKQKESDEPTEESQENDASSAGQS